MSTAPANPGRPEPGPDDLVQMNVRVPRSLRDAVDARRATKGLSRDRWMVNALTYLLENRPPTRARRPQGMPPTVPRTAPPPSRRTR